MQEIERKHMQFVCWLDLLLKVEGCVGGGCEKEILYWHIHV